MPEKPAFFVREALPDDSEAILHYIKVIADEPNNGIAYSSSAEVTRTVDEQKNLIETFHQSDTSLMLVATAESSIMGLLTARGGPLGYRHTIDMTITVHRDWRDKGVGTALLQRLIAWCRANPQVHRLELQVFPDNPRAIHLYEQMGFLHEGARKEAYLKHGEYLDLIMMAMIFRRD